MSLFGEVRSVAAKVAKQATEQAYARAPETVKVRVERARRRFEERRADARRALDDWARIEERALRVGLQIVLFPWATAGAIKELYGRVRELEGSLEKRDQTIRRLEDRIRELEREKPRA